MEMKLLQQIHSPEDLRSLDDRQLKALTGEIRETIVDTVSQNGGHLASNLGAVELTLAMHLEFESPKDSFVWDVGNRVYAAMIADTNREVTDEEARRCRVNVATLSGASELYDAETVKDEILRRIRGGETLREVLLTLPDYNLTSQDYTVAADEYTTTFGPTAMKLTTGQTDAVYVESVNNWYVMTCVTDVDQSATASKKTSIVQERENKNFTEKYTAYRDAAPAFVPNQEAIELLNFNQFLFVPETTEAPAKPEVTEGEKTPDGSEAASAEESEAAGSLEAESESAAETENETETETK